MLPKLTPPEFRGLLPRPAPYIIGWTFQLNVGAHSGCYYSTNSNAHDYFTDDREHAQIYDEDTVIAVSNRAYGWGRKVNGKWRAVYAYYRR